MKTADEFIIRREERAARLNQELPRLVKGLVGLGASRVVLFGSAAAGRLGVTSDLDLIAVIPTDKRPLDRLKWVHEELQPTAADILVYTPAEFEEMKDASPFVRHALKTGKVMHEARSD